MQFLAEQHISQAVLIFLIVLSVSLFLSFFSLIVMTERKDQDEFLWLYGFIANGVVTMACFGIVNVLTRYDIRSADITKDSLDVLFLQLMVLYGFVIVYTFGVLGFIWKLFVYRVTMQKYAKKTATSTTDHHHSHKKTHKKKKKS